MNWDEYFIKMIDVIKEKSKDPRTKIGCISVGLNNEILGTGFNGFPMGVIDSEERYNDRDIKYKFVVHAEQNLISLSARNGIKLNGSKLYVSWYPCSACTKSIIQSGIKEIIIDGNDYENKLRHWKDWEKDVEISKMMCSEAGVKIRIYKGDK